MAKRLPIFLSLLVLAILLTACGLLREPEQASGTIEAIPLEITEQTATSPAGMATGETKDDTSAAPTPGEPESGGGEAQE